ncbi:MAG: outer membrane protein assembly factor BamA, partial [Gammaproteobacteria bacterium]|nr:outer membrane protein assembly factor BamA [Gammaproteobacteria bacterium]
MRGFCKNVAYLFVAFYLCQSTALAMESFTIEDIRLEGLQRISPGTVFNYLPIKVGETFDDARSSEIVRALFKTSFFKDVQLGRDGDVLVITLVERPAIGKITVSGNTDIKTEDLLNGLKQIGFAEGRVFDASLLDKAELELTRQYFSLGKYAVRIKTTVTPVDENRVDVAIDISEGQVAKIVQINIVGNKAFSEKRLLKTFKLTTPTLLSFITKSDQYSRQKLSADLESLRSFYLDHGYINFNIDSTQVSITPDKKDIYITINITESEPYHISEIKLAGELIVPPEDLYHLIIIRQDDLFSRKVVTESSTAITERLGNDGYAFANVNAIPAIDNENKTVAITFFVDPGKRVYVRRITFSGNTTTRDEVLRREMRQLEGGWISTSQVERSKVRLQKLGYFKEVNVETPAVPGTTDQVDVNFSVTEASTGSFGIGAGYAQTGGLILSTSITQDNFLGSGKRVSFAFDNSEVNRRFLLGFWNPYWTVDGVSRGFQGYYRTTDAAQANITAFDSTVWGGGVVFGIPVTEFNSLKLGLDYENTTIDTTVASSQQVTDFVQQNGSQFDSVLVTGAFDYDTRNKALLPDSGTLHAFGAQLAAPLGDLEYYKLDYRTQWFYPLIEDYTLLLQGEVGYGDGYGSTDGLP